MIKRMTSVILAIVMMFAVSVSALAEGYTVNDIPRVIYDDLDEMGTLPPITIDYYYGLSPFGYGDGEVIPRVRQWQTASSGLYRCASQTGNYLAIAAVALGFAGVAPAMTVSQILSALSLLAAAKDSQSVTAETYISYRYTYRDGEGRWSTEPNQDEYYFLGYRTGMRETFKHIMGGYLGSNNRWTTKTKDYPGAVDTEKSPHYDDYDWILQQGKINVILGQVYDETGW